MIFHDFNLIPIGFANFQQMTFMQRSITIEEVCLQQGDERREFVRETFILDGMLVLFADRIGSRRGGFVDA